MQYVNMARSLGSEIAGKLERASAHTEAHGSWIEAPKAPEKRVHSGDARLCGKVRIGGLHDVSQAERGALRLPRVSPAWPITPRWRWKRLV